MAGTTAPRPPRPAKRPRVRSHVLSTGRSFTALHHPPHSPPPPPHPTPPDPLPRPAHPTRAHLARLHPHSPEIAHTSTCGRTLSFSRNRDASKMASTSASQCGDATNSSPSCWNCIAASRQPCRVSTEKPSTRALATTQAHLAKPALLRSLVPEHGAAVVPFVHRASARHSARDERPHESCVPTPVASAITNYARAGINGPLQRLTQGPHDPPLPSRSFPLPSRSFPLPSRSFRLPSRSLSPLPAVPSGRSVTRSSLPGGVKLYISLLTTSDVGPSGFSNTSVCSRIGRRACVRA